MTLLEAVVALVIVGLSAVGWIGLAQGTSRTTRDAERWAQVVATAESAMETALLEGEASPVRALETGSARFDGVRTTVDVRPWGPGLSEVIVTVTPTDGAPFTLHRLIRDGGQ